MASVRLGAALRQIHRLFNDGTIAGLPDARLLERFIATREEAAFVALVERHGPMVLATCRAVLKDEHDAEDAFQATFLVLARNARSISDPAALGGWLHRVAFRVAVEADAAERRRRRRERQAGERAVMTTQDPSFDDFRPALHAEVERLPERYRLPVVLCYLEGLTREQAAVQLGWTENAVRDRLARARERLRARLTRLGLAPSASVLAVALAQEARATVPPVLVDATARAAIGFAAGTAAAGAASASVRLLATGALRGLLWARLKAGATVVLTIAALAGSSAGLIGVGTVGAASKTPPAKAPSVAALAPPAANDERPAADDRAKKDEMVAFGGRVVGPGGQPVAGAKLYHTPASGYLREPFPSPEYATTGRDGRFKFTVSKAKYRDQVTVVAAAAPDHGAGWVEVPPDVKSDALTLQLVPDDTPITGQIVDLEAKPVPGATLRVLQINAAPEEDLGPWLAAAQGKQGPSLKLEQQYLPRCTIALSPQVTTDAEGRFRLTGIGRNRLVIMQLDGPTIASQHLHIRTRPGETITVPEREGQREYGESSTVAAYYGSSFRHVAAPTKPIVGVVRDKDTKEPLAGITVRGYAQATRSPGSFRVLDVIVRTTTDAEGRYRLMGIAKGDGYQIAAVPGGDGPYPISAVNVPVSHGIEPVTVDLDLKRGVWIEGKITDKATGQPLQANVEYFSLYLNPNLRDYPGFDGAILTMGGVGTKEDGSYRLVGLPGPGLVGVYSCKNDHDLRAPERDDEYGTKEPELRTAPYHLFFPRTFSALARIDPAQGVDSVKRDVTLDSGWTFTGRVLGPDGKPLPGVRGFGLTSRSWERERMKTAEFTVRWFNPRRPRDVLFQHPEQGLVGVAQPPQENGGSVTVRMEPAATVTGRLVDADGKPRPGVELKVSFRLKGRPTWSRYDPEQIQTDRDGRFRVEALLPGCEFLLSEGKDELPFDAPRSGQAQDLGDVPMKRAEP